MKETIAPLHSTHPLTGERLQVLLDGLDLERQELSGLAAALRQGRTSDAVHELASFFRGRLAARVVPAPLTAQSKAIADDAVEGRVTVVYIPYAFPHGEIDWRFDATDALGLSHDNEWVWQLNRMNFWPHMAAAYAATGDERYPAAFVRQLRGWAAAWKRPLDSGNVPGSGWRTIECGLRLMSVWPKSMGVMAHSMEVTDADVLLYMWLSLEQLRHLVAHHCPGSNWLTMEMNGVYTFASSFPQFRESGEARRLAMTMLYEDIMRQILPDGAQWEMAPDYHLLSVDCCLSLVRAAMANGFEGEVPQDFLEVLQNGYEYLVKVMTPDRMTPCFNDSGLKENVVERLGRVQSLFPQSREIQWAASGASAESVLRPGYASLFLPWNGRVVFRSGWTEDAVYASFDVGPLGYGHFHQDKLNLTIHAYGEDLLFDDGGGNYEKSLFRSYACSAWDHSVVAVDGLGQRRDGGMERKRLGTPVDATFRTDGIADYAEAVYDQGFGADMKPLAVHRRQVLFVKPDMFFVCDTLTPWDDAEHRYEARWQVDAPAMEETLSGAFVSRRDGANLLVAAMLADGLESVWRTEQLGASEAAMAGLFISMDPRPYRPAATVSHLRQGRGEQRFLTLLMPLRAGQASPMKGVVAKGGGVFQVQLSDGREVGVRMSDASLELLG